MSCLRARLFQAIALALVLSCKTNATESEKLEQRVEAVLEADPEFSHLDVRAEKDGIVHLEGMVETEMQRHRLEEVVRSIPGVKRVENRALIEHGPIVTVPSDSARLGAAIEAALAAHGIVRVSARVDPDAKVVRLEGDVAAELHEDAKRIALGALPSTEGYRVDDALSVKARD